MDIFSSHILACPDCAEPVSGDRCLRCKKIFRHDEGIVCMMPSKEKPLPTKFDDPDYKRYRELYESENADRVYYTNINPFFRWVNDSANKATHSFFERSDKDGIVVDVGCGIGEHFRFFNDLHNVIGIDTSLGSLKVLKKKFPEANAVQGSVYKLPFRDQSIAHIFAVYMLEHVYFLQDALSEVFRVLKPGGHFYVGLPTEGSVVWTMGRKLTTERIMNKKYHLDYGKVMKLEHCNTARAVIRACDARFSRSKRKYFPSYLPVIDLNLTISLEYIK